ncbi:ABC transporter substrate-binding protein [Brevibacillus sp. NRS-1366]|uniref:ABC transporter substrate-binding protein n=1 Tax=Brevibacillus sp. NRS-1366 TaxID=3233899 RepID=UPI003D1DEE8A
MKMFKTCGKTVLASLLAVSLAACSSAEQSQPVPSAKDPGEKITVNFWHSMGGKAGSALDELVKDYNASQNKYVVKAGFQGKYEDTLLKFRNTKASPDAPAVVQVNEISTQAVIDTKKIVPIHTFVERDQFDTSKLEKNVTNYYHIDGKLYSMPFNSSTPLLYYNKDLFAKAGLDPQHPPRTFNEVREAAKKLTIREGNEVKQYGMNVRFESWFFEQLMATQGGFLIDQENGRKGTPTKASIASKEGEAILKWIDDLNKDGSYVNYGANGDDIDSAFQSQKLAMYLNSSGALGTLLDKTKGKFELGVAYLPHPDGVEPQGVVIGGGSLWMTNLVDDSVKEGVWDFMKYLTKADVQAKWHLNTGYFPINVDAYKEESVKTAHEKTPVIQITVNQLHDTKMNTATQGALTTALPEIRKGIVKAMEQTIIGAADYKTALAQAQVAADRAIEIANRTAK